MKSFSEFMQEAYLIEYRVKKSKPSKPYNPEEDEEIKRHANEHGIEATPLLHQARTSSIQHINPSILNASNTDVQDVNPGAKGRRQLRRLLSRYGRNADERIKGILKQKREGQLEPALIHRDEQGNKTVVAGNTRLSLGKIYGFKVPVKMIGHS